MPEQRLSACDMCGNSQDAECGAELYIVADFASGAATIRCRLPKGHEGQHQEVFHRDGREIRVEWDGDEREGMEREREAYERVFGLMMRKLRKP